LHTDIISNGHPFDEKVENVMWEYLVVVGNKMAGQLPAPFFGGAKVVKFFVL
jgi:hypothetical protein